MSPMGFSSTSQEEVQRYRNEVENLLKKKNELDQLLEETVQISKLYDEEFKNFSDDFERKASDLKRKYRKLLDAKEKLTVKLDCERRVGLTLEAELKNYKEIADQSKVTLRKLEQKNEKLFQKSRELDSSLMQKKSQLKAATEKYELLKLKFEERNKSKIQNRPLEKKVVCEEPIDESSSSESVPKNTDDESDTGSVATTVIEVEIRRRRNSRVIANHEARYFEYNSAEVEESLPKVETKHKSKLSKAWSFRKYFSMPKNKQVEDAPSKNEDRNSIGFSSIMNRLRYSASFSRVSPAESTKKKN